MQTVTGALAALDDDLDMIQQQLELQMQAQDQNQDDARSAIIARRQSACPGLHALQRETRDLVLTDAGCLFAALVLSCMSGEEWGQAFLFLTGLCPHHWISVWPC